MTPAEKKAAAEAKAEALKAKKELAEKAAAEKKAADEKAAAEAKELAEKERQELSKGSFIMTVGHLSFGRNGKSHFYADKKPLITLKEMGGDIKTLKVWINAGWVKKGSYKK